MTFKTALFSILFVFIITSRHRDSLSRISEPNTEEPRSDIQTQGLNAEQIELAFAEAEQRNHIYSLLIVKNDSLVAEKYFRG